MAIELELTMLFIIEYDRNQGMIVSMKSFDESRHRAAEEARLEMELGLNSNGIEREVVILEAESEEALRKTHRRYFEDLAALAHAPAL